MKFNTIVGNPPYQISSAGDVNRTNALYHHFIEAATQLTTNYISLITPSRWMTKGGQSIPDTWVDKMLDCNHFIKIYDYLDSREFFNNVEIKGGISYFLYSNNYNGECDYILESRAGLRERKAFLNSMGAGVVIRDIEAVNIIEKVVAVEGEYYIDNSFSNLVSSQHFFGKEAILATSWRGYAKEYDQDHCIKYHLNRNLEKSGVAWIRPSDIQRNYDSVDIYKVYLPKACGTGNDPQVLTTPIFGEKGSACSLTYLVIGYDPIKHNFTKEQCLNIMSYMKTKFFRYMVSIKKRTQDAMSSVFQFAPIQDFNKKWTDKELYDRYKLSEPERSYIEGLIKEL